MIILGELMQQKNRDTISTHEKLITEYWQGEHKDDEALDNNETTATSVLEQGMEIPITQRQLLRGILPRQKAPDRGD